MLSVTNGPLRHRGPLRPSLLPLHWIVGRVMAPTERPWQPPAGYSDAAATEASGILLYNSLVDEKKALVPLAGPHTRELTWYSCGPTVYDSAHLGHSRNYINFDIIRRVLQDYFGYNITAVMNVTDVDDKIIARARRNYLLSQYRASKPPMSQVKISNR